MNREKATEYIGHYVDTALSNHAQPVTDNTKLVMWQCGFEPMVVAVNCYLQCHVEDDEAAELATEYLEEISWFSDEPTEPTEPTAIL